MSVAASLIARPPPPTSGRPIRKSSTELRPLATARRLVIERRNQKRLAVARLHDHACAGDGAVEHWVPRLSSGHLARRLPLRRIQRSVIVAVKSRGRRRLVGLPSPQERRGRERLVARFRGRAQLTDHRPTVCGTELAFGVANDPARDAQALERGPDRRACTLAMPDIVRGGCDFSLDRTDQTLAIAVADEKRVDAARALDQLPVPVAARIDLALLNVAALADARPAAWRGKQCSIAVAQRPAAYFEIALRG